MTTLGLNILAATAHDRNRLNGIIQQTAARAVLVMDDIDAARRFARMRRELLVIHRRHQLGDNALHLTRTAADWVAEIAGDGRDNVVVQTLNEPDGYRDLEVLGLWCALAMREASRRRIRLALPNFAVGHPDEHAIMRGALDDLIVEFGRHPEHLLAVHEYFVEDPTREPYHVGRVQTLLKRFDFLRVPRPLVVVTECGRDVGGGRHDGWRDTGWGEIEYSNRLLSMARVHTQTGVYASCVFCYGPGFGNDWQSFNVDDAGTVLEAAERYNRAVPGRWINHRISRPVRRRQLPSTHAPALEVLRPGRTIQYGTAGVQRDGYTWLPLRDGGWLAGEAAGILI